MENAQLLFEQALEWLLEPDDENPGVRYFALRSLVELPDNDAQVIQAAEQVMQHGLVPRILAYQDADGAWDLQDNTSFGYKSTAAQVMLLVMLGADPADERVQRGCNAALSRTQAANGGFAYGMPAVSSKVVHCHHGGLLEALLRLGCIEDVRVQKALDWLVSAITGEGEIRYYQSATSGPGLECAANQKQPCAWGATKALAALAAVPDSHRNSRIDRAIEMGCEFLLNHDLAEADYPYTGRINSIWFKFGFPSRYSCDVLETAAALVKLGCGSDPRLLHGLEFIASRRDIQGRWMLERTPNGRMWVDIEKKGQPSKWLTLRGCQVLKGGGVA